MKQKQLQKNELINDDHKQYTYKIRISSFLATKQSLDKKKKTKQKEKKKNQLLIDVSHPLLKKNM